MFFRPTAAAAGLLAAALILTGCGSSEAPKAASPLDTVTVTGTDAKKAPTVTLKTKPFTVTETIKKVVTEGTGATVPKDALVKINAEIVNGKDGKNINSTYETGTVGVDLSASDLFPSLKTSIPGTKVGSRLLIASPPKDAFGTQGQSTLGVGATDTLLFVVDVVGVVDALKEAKGTAVAPKAGLPTVAMVAGKPAAITVPKGAKPPAKLVVQPLVQGAGAVVQSGQAIRVIYTGSIWASGKVFDATANHPGAAPTDFQIGVGKVIPGWDKGLVGQKVGSRVLLVIPPADGYGATGNTGAGIKGTDTLVFVVDILAAY